MNSRAAHALIAAGVAGVGGLWLWGVVDLPACPIATYLSILCPMCGSTRAVQAAASGELLLAFQLNPLFPLWCAGVVLVLLDLFWAIAYGPAVHGPCRRVLSGISRRKWLLGGFAILWVGVGLYLNTVMRDILLVH